MRAPGKPDVPSFVEGLPKAEAALRFADRMHRGQQRNADGRPFILHPLEVASLLRAAQAPEELVAAGLLHDVVERCGVAGGDLARRFGQRVTALVLAVSEDDSVASYSARKRALREQVIAAGDDALLLFAADKVSKVRELRLRPSRPIGASVRARRLHHYQACLELLEEQLPEASLVRGLRRELQRLTPEPSAELVALDR